MNKSLMIRILSAREIGHKTSRTRLKVSQIKI